MGWDYYYLFDTNTYIKNNYKKTILEWDEHSLLLIKIHFFSPNTEAVFSGFTQRFTKTYEISVLLVTKSEEEPIY